ncbi:MAG: hypothetical protein ACR2GH_04205 [Pseudonocardia sp.]
MVGRVGPGVIEDSVEIVAVDLNDIVGQTPTWDLISIINQGHMTADLLKRFNQAKLRVSASDYHYCRRVAVFESVFHANQPPIE